MPSLEIRPVSRRAPALATVVATKRAWAPFLAAVLCLIASGFAPPVLGWLAIVASLGLLVDGFAVLLSHGGTLRDHRQ